MIYIDQTIYLCKCNQLIINHVHVGRYVGYNILDYKLRLIINQLLKVRWFYGLKHFHSRYET